MVTSSLSAEEGAKQGKDQRGAEDPQHRAYRDSPDKPFIAIPVTSRRKDSGPDPDDVLPGRDSAPFHRLSARVGDARRRGVTFGLLRRLGIDVPRHRASGVIPSIDFEERHGLASSDTDGMDLGRNHDLGLRLSLHFLDADARSEEHT